jgi:predicted nuclease with TOPRIM domain
MTSEQEVSTQPSRKKRKVATRLKEKVKALGDTVISLNKKLDEAYNDCYRVRNRLNNAHNKIYCQKQHIREAALEKAELQDKVKKIEAELEEFKTWQQLQERHNEQATHQVVELAKRQVLELAQKKVEHFKPAAVPKPRQNTHHIFLY